MARITLEHRQTPMVRLMQSYSRRRYGKVLEPGLVMLHHRKVLRTILRTERGAAKWSALPPTLQALAVMATSAQIGCQWCLDFGYWEYHHKGVEPRKLREVSEWGVSEAYTDLERRVIAFAVAATQTPPEVTDDMVAGLREDLSEEQVVELTYWVALENQRSRVNAAMGLAGQGFKESCDLSDVREGAAT